MTVATGALRATTLLAIGALVATWPALGTAVPAHAHNYVVDTNPAADSTITELPERISVTTNQPMLTLGGSTAGFALEVRDAAGLHYGDGCVEVEGSTLSSAAALGKAGTYTVLWQAVSADGHPVSDEFAFEWAPVDGESLSPGSAAVPDCHGTAGVQQEPDEDAPAEASAQEPADLGTLVWIGSALLAVALAVTITLLAVRRRG